MYAMTLRIGLFVAAHAAVIGAGLLVASAGGEGDDAAHRQPRYQSHSVAPFANDGYAVEGRFHAGGCRDPYGPGLNMAADYVPDTDAMGYLLPPVVIGPSYHADSGPQAFVYSFDRVPTNVEQHFGLVPDDGIVVDTARGEVAFNDHVLDQGRNTWFRYDPCADNAVIWDSEFIDK
jgi:hypothetical protein